jgi:Caspase domain
MTLVLDERANLKDGPGFHALIAGVSAYPHLSGGSGTPAVDSFGLRQLTSPALTAHKIYRWLIEHKSNLPVPLASVRMLLSPSESEKEVEPELDALQVDRCTRGNFVPEVRRWREDAMSHDENITFFYHVGHGIQLSRSESVLFLEDFGAPDAPLMLNAVSVQHIYNGMAPPGDPQKEMARTQLYFIDASSLLPPAISQMSRLSPPDIFDIALGGLDDRRAPIFYASVPGSLAYAHSKKQTLFSEALLRCLNGEAAVPSDNIHGEVQWGVSITSLMNGLTKIFSDVSEEYGIDQRLSVSGVGSDTIICYLDSPPPVKIILEIDPPSALPFMKIEILDDAGVSIRTISAPITPHPYIFDLAAGIYIMKATMDPPVPGLKEVSPKTRLVMPPSVHWKLKVDAS